VYLVVIKRDDHLICAMIPEEIIKESDVLVFAGQRDAIDELRTIDHLVLETDRNINADYFNHTHIILLKTVITWQIDKPHLTKKTKGLERNIMLSL